MGLALDEPRDEDLRYEVDDLLWVVRRDDQASIMNGAQGLRVDYQSSWGRAGFVVSRVGAGASCC